MKFTDSDREKRCFRYHFWLAFNSDGSMKMTRTEPDVSRYERSMKLAVEIPYAVFNVPTLTAKVTVEAPPAGVPPIDTTAAAEALKKALGVDVDIQIIPAGDPE